MNPAAVLLLVIVTGCASAPATPAGPLIIILADHHFVSREDFAADLACARGSPASEESIDLQYAAFLDDVEDPLNSGHHQPRHRRGRAREGGRLNAEPLQH